MSSKLNSRIPEGPISEKWTKHKGTIPLVSPANKRRIDVIVVGTGLAGSSAAASRAELGYNVKAFCFQDSPRRAHSIAAQGGINAADRGLRPERRRSEARRRLLGENFEQPTHGQERELARRVGRR